MTPNFWFSVIYVLQRIHLFRPYTKWIENFLAYLDNSMEINLNEAREWIKNTENPDLAGFRRRLGHGWENLVTFMAEEGEIKLHGNSIIYTLEEVSVDP